MLPDTSKTSASADSKLSAQKDPTGQFVDKSVQVTGFEDGRERPTRFKDDKKSSTLGSGAANLLLQPTDPDGGGGGLPMPYASVGPYKFVSSVGSGLDGGADNPGQYILDLTIAKGSSAAAGPEAGYTKIDADLNSGAGGKYIYLCFSRNTVSDRDPCGKGWSKITPISDIRAIAWQTFSDALNPATYCGIQTQVGTVWPFSYKVPDLNDGAGGRYIYAYQQKSATPNPIREVGVVAGNNSGIQPPLPWVRTGDDLNKGAGGDYIYLCYKR